MSEYFRLNNTDIDSEHQETNMAAVIEAEKLDFNSLFLPNAEKNYFYDQVKY